MHQGIQSYFPGKHSRMNVLAGFDIQVDGERKYYYARALLAIFAGYFLTLTITVISIRKKVY